MRQSSERIVSSEEPVKRPLSRPPPKMLDRGRLHEE